MKVNLNNVQQVATSTLHTRWLAQQTIFYNERFKKFESGVASTFTIIDIEKHLPNACGYRSYRKLLFLRVRMNMKTKTREKRLFPVYGCRS